MKQVAFYTFGCKLNQYETAVLSELFIKHEYEVVNFSKSSDIYIINSCSVTNKADYKAREFIRKARKNNPDAIFIIIGCSVENYPEKFDKLDFIDYLIGTGDKLQFFLENIETLQKNSSTVFINKHEPEFNKPEDFALSKFLNHTRAFLKIQDGCNYACTYCAVRLARGMSRSKPVSNIIEEINNLISNGYKEIVLTGVNLGLYGLDLNQKLNFAELLKVILSKTDIKRLRISSIDPEDVNDDLIEIFKKFPDRLCRHLHISIQSLSDKILVSMKRRNSVNDIINLIAKLKKESPEINIGGDIIVGFPGETEELFLKTLNTLKNIDINYLHIFPYSRREKTIAADLPDQVNGEEKIRRVKILRKLNQEKKDNFSNRFTNFKLNFLIENRLSKSGNLIGISDNYLSVEFNSTNKEYFNQVVEGVIISINPLKGKLFSH